MTECTLIRGLKSPELNAFAFCRREVSVPVLMLIVVTQPYRWQRLVRITFTVFPQSLPRACCGWGALVLICVAVTCMGRVAVENEIKCCG